MRNNYRDADFKAGTNQLRQGAVECVGCSVDNAQKPVIYFYI